MDSQNIKYATIIFVFLDIKMMEHSAKISCHTNISTSLKQNAIATVIICLDCAKGLLISTLIIVRSQ